MDTTENKQQSIASLPLYHVGKHGRTELLLEIGLPTHNESNNFWNCAVALRGDAEFHDWFLATGKTSLESLCKAVEVARLFTILTAERVGQLTTTDGRDVLENENLFFQ